MKIKYKVILLALIFCSCLVLNLYVSSNKNSELTSNEIIDTDSNIAPTPTTQPTNENVTSIYNFPAKGIPVLMYHSISSRPNNSLCVPEIQFAKEMEWLSNQNYHCLTIEEFYLALVDDDPLPEKSILLTFDDGYVDNYKVALPILEHYNFKATFFIIVNSIGAEGMSLDQIKELTKKGYSIGSHTSNHLDLSILSAKRQENELMISKQKLEDSLGIKISAFCYPSGRYNGTTLDLMKKSGYAMGFTTYSEKVHLGDNLYTLKRLRIPAGMSLAKFQAIIN